MTKYFDLPEKQAAKTFGVSTTTLAKHFRHYGIPRWPYRKITTCAFRCLLRSPVSQSCLHTHFTHQKARRLPQTLLSALGAMATSEKRSQS
jgi:hypothetical protein